MRKRKGTWGKKEKENVKMTEYRLHYKQQEHSLDGHSCVHPVNAGQNDFCF